MSDDVFPTFYQSFIAKSRYARWIEEENRRETWEETVQRYVDFFDDHVAENYPHALNDYREVKEELYSAIYNLEVMPSMRALMSAGPALKRDVSSSYNCSFTVIDSPRAFDEMMYILMTGSGVGFSVERQYISQLPVVAEEFYETDTVISVHDSRIGWAKALRELLSLLWVGQIPKWDLSKLRPKGARLKTFGGRSSGPDPLDKLFKFAVATFRKAAGRKLSSIECHDLACKIGDVVVSGGVRRSALISLSNLSDDRMRVAKSGSWWLDNPQRKLANNSATFTEVPEMSVFMKEWMALYDSKSGERGIFSRLAAKKKAESTGRRDPNHDFGCNPCCVSGDTKILTSRGNLPIEDLVGVEVEIWNGTSFEPVIPFEAGVAPLYRVHLSNGVHIDCTSNHRFINRKGEFVYVKDMNLGMKLKPFEMPVKSIEGYCSFSVVDIEDLNREEMTYCFNEPKTSRGTFNGIVTGNSEIILRPNQFCNLSEIVIRSNDTRKSVARKARIASILGTLQSSLTNFRYLRKVWQRNCEEERLLGVSLTGIMDNEDLVLDAKRLTYWKSVVVETNQDWADKLGIERSTACTAVKPSGTVSQLVDSSSGLHARYSPYYIRRVRCDATDPLAQYMQVKGFPWNYEVNDPNVLVFDFPMKSPESAVFRDDMDAISQVEVWEMLNEFWCEHKPSCTVYYTDQEFLELGAYIYKNFDSISGISFLPHSDHVYDLAPYEEVSKEKYEELLKLMPKEFDWSELSTYETEDHTVGNQTLACSGGVCEVVDLTS